MRNELLSPQESLHFFHYSGSAERISPLPESPLRIAVVTSQRDVVGEDQNGQEVEISPGRREYIQGVPEAIVRGIGKTREECEQLQLVTVITDDTETDRSRGHLLNNPLEPTLEYSWIHPLDLRDPHSGNLVTQNTYHLPSEWRHTTRIGTPERAAAKREWEEHLATIAKEARADVILSDHLMVILQTLIEEQRGLLGRMLNIHPAVTVKGDPYQARGATPTADTLERAYQDGGTWTGSTLHFLTEGVDKGAPIAFTRPTEVSPHDTPMGLRERNYRKSKIPTTIFGLLHYYHNLFHQRRNIDLTRSSQPAADEIESISFPELLNPNHVSSHTPLRAVS